MFVHRGDPTWQARNVFCSFWYCSLQLLCSAQKFLLSYCWDNIEQLSSPCMIQK